VYFQGEEVGLSLDSSVGSRSGRGKELGELHLGDVYKI
jgi:hypothetical protein